MEFIPGLKAEEGLQLDDVIKARNIRKSRSTSDSMAGDRDLSSDPSRELLSYLDGPTIAGIPEVGGMKK